MYYAITSYAYNTSIVGVNMVSQLSTLREAVNYFLPVVSLFFTSRITNFGRIS